MLRNNVLIAGGNLGEVGIGLYHTGSLQFLICCLPRVGRLDRELRPLVWDVGLQGGMELGKGSLGHPGFL